VRAIETPNHRLLRLIAIVLRCLDWAIFVLLSGVALLLIVNVVVFLGMLLWVAIGLGNFVDKRLQGAADLTPSLRVLIGKVLKIVLIVAATLVGLSGLGIDLTVFAVFSGAIGVGLGFGLQKGVSNFISGIIILMDRSIKPGDTITLGETYGGGAGVQVLFRPASPAPTAPPAPTGSGRTAARTRPRCAAAGPASAAR
jgi:small-conductance mechanosensitive channel